MLQLADAGKRFGHKLLFEHVNWLITPHERTALVGANGTGKTTMMRILAGEDTLDYGNLQRTRGMTIGYLPQDGLTLTGKTVFEECLSVFDELRGMEHELHRLGHALSELDPESGAYGVAAERYSHLESRLRALDGYALDAQVGAVLTGLGFSKTDWARSTNEFSGGWQMRIALGRLLLAKPSLLLLDEPTNHLDLESRNWLEDYLKNYPNGFVLISHDRYFLDVTVNKIVELWNKGLHVYHGNYAKYLTQKQERRTQLEAAYRNQREQIESLEAFIERFRYQATKARQVQSRIKELERMERIEIPEEEPEIHFHFPQPPASGRTVVEAIHAQKSYGEKRVLTDVNFTIERGDRIALVGANGAGKSTLVRLLSGQESASGGQLKLGHNVLAEYFAQDQYKVLDPTARMLDDISRTAPKVAESELRSLLGCFLFSGDDVFKPLGVLSGGERNRYALARILVSPANFLLLDEPTNHLDLRAKDVLLEAIESFTGTVLFVSHDRYFIDRLASRVFEVEGGKVLVYPGNYEDYLRRKEGTAAPAPTQAQTQIQANPAPPNADKPNPSSSSASEARMATSEKSRRVNPIKRKQMEDRTAAIEEELTKIEQAISEAEAALAVFVSAAETQRLSDELAALRKLHTERTEEWENLMLELEETAAS